MPKFEEADAESVGELSVVDRIFTSFIDALAGTEGFSDVAERLKITILEKRDLSEPSLDLALFNDQQP